MTFLFSKINLSALDDFSYGDVSLHQNILEYATLKARGFCKIYTEAVAASLIAAGHFGGGVAEVFLDVALVHFGRTGET